ncbi:MAG: HEAT repeat domain-containing protein [Kiritimatiellae bacterium]|nr:HEAT repeat domain-containing protein [Kiritimatiellia bacterium]MDD5519395.1 HEAT repeat domain-containing protein [Kiritimatiellia bacterium]
MRIHSIGLSLLMAGFLVLPLRVSADSFSCNQEEITRTIAAAANYESGMSLEPLRQIEIFVRQAVGKPGLCREIEAGLVKLLKPSSTFEAKRFACEQLAVIGSDESLPAVTALLKNNDTVGIACLALGVRPSVKANEALRSALSLLQGAARLQVIGALGDRCDAESVELLADFARNPDVMIAETAITALRKIGNESALGKITAFRAETNPALASVIIGARFRTAEQLVTNGDRKAAAAIYTEFSQPSLPVFVRRAAFTALLQLDKDGGEQRILDTLHGADTALKPVAIAGIRSLKAWSVSKKFACELPKLRPEEQVCMIEALASRDDSAALAAIRNMILSSDALVRHSAVTAVGKLDGAKSVPLLSRALANTQDREELQVIELALSNLKGGRKTDKTMIKEMKNTSGSVKNSLISVAAKRHSRVAMPALLEETTGTDASTVRVAYQALAKLSTGDDLPVLLEKLKNLKAPEARPDAESAIAITMTKIENPVDRTDVICATLAKSNDIAFRSSLLRLLPTCADARALATLKAALKDNDSNIRETAVRTLTEWPDDNVWDALTGIRRQAEKELFRTLALRGMVRLAAKQNAAADAKSMDRYRQLFADAQNDDERKLVLSALAGAVHPDALQLALSLLSNSAVRAEAELAVKKIAAAIKDKNPQAAQDALKKLKTVKP